MNTTEPTPEGSKQKDQCIFEAACDSSPKHELEQFCGCYNQMCAENADLRAALAELKQAAYDYGDQLQIWLEEGRFRHWPEVEKDLLNQMIIQGESAIERAKKLAP